MTKTLNLPWIGLTALSVIVTGYAIRASNPNLFHIIFILSLPVLMLVVATRMVPIEVFLNTEEDAVVVLHEREAFLLVWGLNVLFVLFVTSMMSTAGGLGLHAYYPSLLSEASIVSFLLLAAIDIGLFYIFDGIWTRRAGLYSIPLQLLVFSVLIIIRLSTPIAS